MVKSLKNRRWDGRTDSNPIIPSGEIDRGQIIIHSMYTFPNYPLHNRPAFGTLPVTQHATVQYAGIMHPMWKGEMSDWQRMMG